MANGGFSDHFVTARDGLRLHLREYGERTAPGLPVVCLPGLARTAADFDLLAAALAGDPQRPRRVLANQVSHESVREHPFQRGANLDPHALARHIDDEEQPAPIDASPNTQRAPHDRAMRAFGLCTLCLTNRQRFFTEHFANAELFTYSFDKESLREKVADVLAHRKRYVELGLAVAEEFRRDRRPEDFGQFMIDTASHVRLACGPRHPALQDFFVWLPSKQQ